MMNKIYLDGNVKNNSSDNILLLDDQEYKAFSASIKNKWPICLHREY